MAAVGDFRYVVVPHTHWDREWYLPLEQFRLGLGEVVDEVLDVLERDPSFGSFTLDGQAIVLEDYVEVRPHQESRLRALIASGRLEIGPSYVLPDELLVGGEALVRNLLLGREVCRRFGGEPSPVGYLPDSFGHPAQLPQLLAGFGIGAFLFSRGLGDELDEVGVVFRWQAPDSSEVVAAQLLPHYDNLTHVTSSEDATARVERIVARFGDALDRAGVRTIALCNGTDHAHIQPELPELSRELGHNLGAEVRLGTFAEVARNVSSLESLPAHRGELVGGRLQNVLRGVNSARMHLKQANARAEARLLAGETLLALRTLRDGRPFPAADVRLAWRDLLRNQPHDSICGCSCDEVHRDMVVRWEQLDRTLAALEARAGDGGDELVFANPLPYRRTRLVEHGGRHALLELDGLERRRPALDPLPATDPSLVTTCCSIGNGIYDVEGFADGTLAVTDLRSGRTLEGLHVLEDEPDLGDLYTFCPDPEASVRRCERAAIRVVRGGPLVHELELTAEAPCGPVRTVVRLVDGVDRVELRTTVENRAGDHRLRVAFPLSADTDVVRVEAQFEVVHRPLDPIEPRAPWAEPPAATAHTQGAVALGPLVLLTRGLPEYEAHRDGLHLTLLRCVGTISRGDGLPTRPLRAGPPLETPEGQCLGEHEFEYALRLDGEDLGDAALVRAAQDYRTDFVPVRGSDEEPPLSIEGDLVFSALKGAEDGDGLVLRLFNPDHGPVEAVVNGAVQVARLRLDESDEEPIAANRVRVEAGAIATLRLRGAAGAVLGA